MHPLCLLRSLWWSFRAAAPVSGHDYRTDPEKTPANVHILRCELCGHRSMAWSWSSLEHQK
jgi:hypothetical protein